MEHDTSLTQRLRFFKFDEETKAAVRSLKPIIEEELSSALDFILRSSTCFPGGASLLFE